MEERPPLPELPWDVWVNILSRLPMISIILQVRSVCKEWRLLLAHPHFTKVHSQKLEQYPALLYFNFSTRCLTHVELIGDGSNGGGDTTTTNDTPSSSATAVMKLKVEDYALNPVAKCNGEVCFSCRSNRFAGNTPYYVGNPLVDRVQDFARVEELTRNPDEDSCIGGFGLSLKTKRYKIVGLYYPPTHSSGVKVADCQILVKICTISPRWKGQDNWRDLGPFPLGGRRPLNLSRSMIGSYLDGGIHWVLFRDRHYPALISRLDLDSEQFEWLSTPECEDFQSTKGILRLRTSGGHLIICADWSIDWCTRSYTSSIWVRMKESWTKKFVVKRPFERIGWWQLMEDVRVLNYVPQQVDEAAGRREAAEVVLLYCSRSERIFALCSTLGHYVPGCRYVPSLVSIYGA